MTVHSIRIVGDPVLQQPTRQIEAFDDALRALVEDMEQTMDAANGVGLAANQIGVDLRVFVYDIDGHRGHVVNPRIETSEVPETMPDPDDDDEGCLSVPGLAFPTGRADAATVHGFDVQGEPITVTGTGMLARCLQHEVDHLDGRLYLDRLTGRWVKEARRAVRRNGWGRDGLAWQPGVDPDPFGH